MTSAEFLHRSTNMSAKPNVGLDLMTVRSGHEPKPGAGFPTDCATEMPLCWLSITWDEKPPHPAAVHRAPSTFSHLIFTHQQMRSVIFLILEPEAERGQDIVQRCGASSQILLPPMPQCQCWPAGAIYVGVQISWSEMSENV